LVSEGKRTREKGTRRKDHQTAEQKINHPGHFRSSGHKVTQGGSRTAIVSTSGGIAPKEEERAFQGGDEDFHLQMDRPRNHSERGKERKGVIYWVDSEQWSKQLRRFENLHSPVGKRGERGERS